MHLDADCTHSLLQEQFTALLTSHLMPVTVLVLLFSWHVMVGIGTPLLVHLVKVWKSVILYNEEWR